MGLPLAKYVQIKDNYCCFYQGNAPEYVVALRLLRPQIEKHLPGLNFFIGCRDELGYLLDGENNIVLASQLPEKHANFSYIRELRNEQNQHSVLKLMEESCLDIKALNFKSQTEKGLCLICPEGIEPTKSMNQNCLEICINQTILKGYTPIVLGSDVHQSMDLKIRPQRAEKFNYIKEASWVIGVENEYLLLAAEAGKKTDLLATGVGERLYKKLFPAMEVV
jgi:hypothetical protein